MKMIKIVLIIFLSLMLGSCSIFGFEDGEESTIIDSNVTINVDTSSQSPEATREEDTDKQSDDVTLTSSSQQGETVCFNVDKPSVLDLFDIDGKSRYNDAFFRDYYCYDKKNKCYKSFTQIIIELGKPYGFRIDNPDTLVWISTEGNPYCIRFEPAPEFEGDCKNALDQYVHSVSAYMRLTSCKYLSGVEFDFDELPLVKDKYFHTNEDVDFQPLSELFDTTFEHLVPEEEISNYVCEWMTLEELVTLFGKPHSCVPDKTSASMGFVLLWMTDLGNVYGIDFNGVKTRIDQFTGKDFSILKRIFYCGRSASHHVVNYTDKYKEIYDLNPYVLSDFVDGDNWIGISANTMVNK